MRKDLYVNKTMVFTKDDILNFHQIVVDCNGKHEYLEVKQTTNISSKVETWLQCKNCGKTRSL